MIPDNAFLKVHLYQVTVICPNVAFHKGQAYVYGVAVEYARKRLCNNARNSCADKRPGSMLP